MTGSRVEKVYQPDTATVQIRLFPPRDSYLSVSAAATQPYFVLIGDKLPVPPAPLRFCQLLRSRLEGGAIEEIAQVGTDRIVRVVFRKREDDGDHRYELVAELFAPHADAYLFDLDQHRFLGRLKNGPAPERFEEGYVAPEAAARPSAFGMDVSTLTGYVERAMDGTAMLYRELDSVPPGLAKLTLALAEDYGAANAAGVLAQHLALVEQHAYAPCLLEDARGAKELLVAPLNPLPKGWTPTNFASVAELARRVMVVDVRAGRMESKLAGVAKVIRDMRHREEERLRHTRENLERCGQADQMETFGNLLKGQLALVLPYRDSVEVVNWYDPEGGKVRIPLKKNLSARQNADRYFLKAKKLRASVSQLEARLAEHTDNLAHLADLESRLSPETAEELEGAVRAMGRVSTGKPRTEKAGGPLEFVSSEGFRILVGRSSRENDQLSRKLARPHDMWLHAKGLAGAHVVVRMKNAEHQCPPATLEEAAQLAAHYSKGRYAAKVEVLYTRAAKVRKPQGLAPGQVLVDGAASMMVRTDPQAPARLARPL